MNVGIVGCGLMGRTRARSLEQLPEHRLTAVYDPDQLRARELAKGGDVEASYQALVEREDIDAVIIAVPHNLSGQISIDALRNGKHVFCEKPLGIDAAECSLVRSACAPNQTLAVGFNYRFYPGVQLARNLIVSGEIGELTHMRATLAHGARPGYEKEWKTSREACGGGALLDPGIHVVDLIRFFAGEIESADALLFRSFWPIDVEDNAFVNFSLNHNRYAQAHVSVTEWKNRFTLEFQGSDGYVHVSGRGGFYGPQAVRFNTRWPWLESPAREEQTREFANPESSFVSEMASFFRAIETGSYGDLATAEDNFRATTVIEKLYAETEIRRGSSRMASIVGTV